MGRVANVGFIAGFLSGYTENFLVPIALWPLASAALTLPILAWLYHRDGRLRMPWTPGRILPASL